MYTVNELAKHSNAPAHVVRKIIQNRIDENRVKIDEMVKLQNRMESALTMWQTMPDGEPDGHSVCHLIESFGDMDTKQ